ncbi:serine/threonine-protein kinase [Pontiellaceae bacterium B1224]|nr:serine/threonine-protein kinase [Pontiellaceae bacterium B1224]
MSSDYQPDRRLKGIYSAANALGEVGLESLCPSFVELSESDDRYRDDEEVGRGALKQVFRTYDAHTHRWIAMARLREDRGEDFYDLFIHEAWLVSSLSHPNIIKVHDTGVDAEGRPFFTMDLKSNTTLADLVEESGAELNTLLQVFEKICDAVAYAHSRGVLHLDLKPDNVQTDAFGEVLVCDWGLAKAMDEMGENEDEDSFLIRSLGGMTLLGQIKGSPGYMAPEQADPDQPKGVGTDVYALGCMLYFLLTGQAPYQGTAAKILEDTAASRVVSPRLKFPKRYIPASLDAVVMKAMALKPEDRYQSVTNLKAEIDKYLGGYATRAEESGFFKEARLFIARNRIPTLITVSSFLVLSVMGVLFIQHLSRQKQATELERGRADQLDSEYAAYVEETLDGHKELADTLATSVRRLVEVSILERPIETVDQCRKMVEVALQQDPGNADAYGEHFALDCLVLDHRAALQRPDSIKNRLQYPRFIRFVEAFPEFDFSRQKRPSIEALTDYFKQARILNPEHVWHMERVLAYDYASRRDKRGYAPAVEAVLQYQHEGPDHLKLSHYARTSVVSLWSDRDVRLILSGWNGPCLLRFLPFRFLELDIAGTFPLADLADLPIESLDISRSPQIELGRSVSLPQLRRLIVQPGQFPENELRKKIQSNEPYEIVEAAPDAMNGYSAE